MKTSLNFNDELIRRGKWLAAERGTTLHHLAGEGASDRAGRDRCATDVRAPPRDRAGGTGARLRIPLIETRPTTSWKAIVSQGVAVDTSILVYAHRQESQRHERAWEAVAGLAEGDEPWAPPVFVLSEFLRVVIHPRVYSPPTFWPVALATVEALLASPTVRVLTPGDRFWPLFKERSRRAR